MTFVNFLEPTEAERLFETMRNIIGIPPTHAFTIKHGNEIWPIPPYAPELVELESAPGGYDVRLAVIGCPSGRGDFAFWHPISCVDGSYPCRCRKWFVQINLETYQAPDDDCWRCLHRQLILQLRDRVDELFEWQDENFIGEWFTAPPTAQCPSHGGVAGPSSIERSVLGTSPPESTQK